MYKNTHDQTVRLMSQGYIGSEISEMIEFPDEIGKIWSSRGYYGTLRHNSRAVYQRYMG
ncbi:sulfatase [Vibrio parahaemolyticus SBR10290]|nr:sulfatase domain protein [Vibrio parahaemolyticus 10296]ESW41763.1 sulfatase domain protein [Vibrio parahaemolyticus 12310]ETT15681.1 sulfatase domain protein [Vibrio parahaemolyticus 3256]ETX50381.1 sulfatase [Vibrio parahaemolyticus SBR10290]EVU12362.1 sulfatase domain protein [Vibrio parahaemolyticus V-223/04]